MEGIFNVDNYIELSPEDRNRLDDWLRSCGGRPEKTQSIELDDGYIIAVEYYSTTDGKLLYDRKNHEVVTTVRRLKAKGNPPVWKK